MQLLQPVEMQVPVVNPIQQTAAGAGQVTNLRPQAPQPAAELLTTRAVRGAERAEDSRRGADEAATRRPAPPRHRGSLIDLFV